MSRLSRKVTLCFDRASTEKTRRCRESRIVTALEITTRCYTEKTFGRAVTASLSHVVLRSSHVVTSTPGRHYTCHSLEVSFEVDGGSTAQQRRSSKQTAARGDSRLRNNWSTSRKHDFAVIEERRNFPCERSVGGRVTSKHVAHRNALGHAYLNTPSLANSVSRVHIARRNVRDERNTRGADSSATTVVPSNGLQPQSTAERPKLRGLRYNRADRDGVSFVRINGDLPRRRR